MIRAILPEALTTCETTLTPMWTVQLGDKRQIAGLLRELPSLPPDFLHLKRVNQGKILLECAKADNSTPTQKLVDIVSLTTGNDMDFLIAQVPARPPRSRAQFEAASKYWPCSFHEDKALEALLDSSKSTHNEQQTRQSFSKVSQPSKEEEALSGLNDLFLRVEKSRGALFYDPANNRVLVEADSKWDRQCDPLGHPVMRCAELLATLQRKKEKIDATSKGDQYLATGLDVIVHSEPCTMCAMALVHCRVRRVFFHQPCQRLGALSSRWRLQELKELNHHYAVFQYTEEDLSNEINRSCRS